MKNEKLMDYIGQIDESFIIEADVPTKNKKKNQSVRRLCLQWGKRLSAAAAIILCITAFALLLRQRSFYHENSSGNFAGLTDSTSEPVTETSSASSAEVKILVDYFHKYEKHWEENIEFELPEFPDVKFRWDKSKLVEIKENTETVLVEGMPVWNVFAVDLNGDNKPELCATSSFGSGIVDERVVIIDYANNAWYALCERMIFDYILTVSDGKLVLEKRSYIEPEAEGTIGNLSIRNKQLIVEFSNGDTKIIDAVVPSEQPTSSSASIAGS